MDKKIINMSTYSIKDLEVISGIKAHTIRIWEQRYGLLEPQRTATNIRYYDDVQMRKLLHVSTLLDNGDKVSKIASYSDAEIHQKVTDLINNANSTDSQSGALINQIISAGLTYDEDSFNKAFKTAVEVHGLINAFLNVIYPMLIRIGLMWTKQDMIPSQEHFISSLIKQKLFAAIENIKEKPKKNAEKWILFLPEDEDHEIGLLLSAFLLKSNGKKVLLIGQRVPYPSIQAILSSEKPDKIHFFMIRNHAADKVQNILDNISPMTSGIKVFVSGVPHLEDELVIPANFKWVNSIESFKDLIN